MRVDAESARAVLQRFGGFAGAFADCFGRTVPRTAASQYLEGLFNDIEPKSMKAMHGRLEETPGQVALQAPQDLTRRLAFLGSARGEGTRLDVVREARQYDRVQRAIQLPVAGAVQTMPDPLASRGGDRRHGRSSSAASLNFHHVREL